MHISLHPWSTRSPPHVCMVPIWWNRERSKSKPTTWSCGVWAVPKQPNLSCSSRRRCKPYPPPAGHSWRSYSYLGGAGHQLLLERAYQVADVDCTFYKVNISFTGKETTRCKVCLLCAASKRSPHTTQRVVASTTSWCQTQMFPGECKIKQMDMTLTSDGTKLSHMGSSAGRKLISCGQTTTLSTMITALRIGMASCLEF